MELQDRILSLRVERYTYLTKIFENLNETQLNLQPLENKRSIAELLSHIGLVDGFPFFLAKIVQRTYLHKVVKKSQDRKLDGSDYEWNLSKGNKRIPKYKSKNKLEKQFMKNKQKINQLDYKEKDKKFRYFSERHANFHIKQLKILIDIVEIKI